MNLNPVDLKQHDDIAQLRAALAIMTFKQTRPSTSIAIKLQQAREPYKFFHGILIYPSKGGVGLKLNGKARDRENGLIECRHLAAHLIRIGSRGIKDYHHDYASAQSLAKIDFLRSNVVDKSRQVFNSSYYHVFDLERLGSSLRRIAECLNYGEETSVLFSSENHTMAITVMCKRMCDDKRQTVIKFYDPNVTDKHIRILCENVKNLTRLRLQELLSSEDYREYFPKLTTAVLASVKQQSRLQRPMVELGVASLQHSLHHCLKFGIVEPLNDIKRHLIESKQVLSYLDLSAKNDVGTPGLFLALQNGHHHVLRPFLSLIAYSDVNCDPEALYNLLLACNARGMSGLAMAIQMGHRVIVEQFIREVCAMALHDLDKSTLVAAHRVDKCKGLFMAMQNGQAEIVECLLTAYFTFECLRASRITLLLSHNDMLAPALFIAMQEGQTEAVKIYLKHILNSDLSLIPKVKCLFAKRPNGTTGLFIAMQNGHVETIVAYMKAILSSNLPRRNQKEMLRAFNRFDTSGLWVAMNCGQSKAVEAYVRCLLEAKWPTYDVLPLLYAYNLKTRQAGVGVALAEQHDDTVAVFARLLQEYNLTDSYIRGLQRIKINNIEQCKQALSSREKLSVNKMTV